MFEFLINQAVLKPHQKMTVKEYDHVGLVFCKFLKIKKTVPVSIAFVSPKKMRELNKIYRGKDSMTDVLSFNLNTKECFGEIVFSFEQAKIQAFEMKHPIKNELIFLLVHGLLHLFGYDHENEKDQKKMFEIQTKILKKLKINPRV